jgi:hypothetical protein
MGYQFLTDHCHHLEVIRTSLANDKNGCSTFPATLTLVLEE